ncbi:MAG TPA: hypothetical protein VH081_10015 [Solirubrobacteraceae bacterium]|jgi:hypothetical protein|nr:hypothetical protein [Solirubrobacteraceae bacterium]
MSTPATPIVVQYLYVHDPEEGFDYPTARAGGSAAEVARRYLECALTQATSLAFRDVDCELVLATNVTDRRRLGRVGAELIEKIESLGTRILVTEYVHRPRPGTEHYVSSRYVLDAMLAASAGEPAERQLWFTDLDCVWADPAKVFASAPEPPQIGCIYIEYPPDWDTVGFERYGRTRLGIGELAQAMGGSEAAPPWVGGELLTGRPQPLRDLVAVCEQLDAQLESEGKTLPNEEQILSLAGAVGRVEFRDLSHIARRMPTGSRTSAAPVEQPRSLGFWHLPSEKGLSLRRTAEQVRRGRTRALKRDLADPARTARRFNVEGTSALRQLRDDGWIVAQRVRRLAA